MNRRLDKRIRPLIRGTIQRGHKFKDSDPKNNNNGTINTYNNYK